MKIRTGAWGGGEPVPTVEDGAALTVRRHPENLEVFTPDEPNARALAAFDVQAFGTGVIMRDLVEDGTIRETHVPLEDVGVFGVSPASAGKVSSFTMPTEVSPLDTVGSKRGKVSRLDGQAVTGEVSALDK